MRNKLSVMMTVPVVLSLLAGCSGGTPQVNETKPASTPAGTQKPAETAKVPEPAKTGKTTVQFWHSPRREKFGVYGWLNQTLQ